MPVGITFAEEHAPAPGPAKVVLDRRKKPSGFSRISPSERPRSRAAGDRSDQTHAVYPRLAGGPSLRRQATVELNKGEARNALARAVCFHGLGRVRDRSSEALQHHAGGLALVTAAIVLWNTVQIAKVIDGMRAEGEMIRTSCCPSSRPSALTPSLTLRLFCLAVQSAGSIFATRDEPQASQQAGAGHDHPLPRRCRAGRLGGEIVLGGDGFSRHFCPNLVLVIGVTPRSASENLSIHDIRSAE